jgi:hypothetical protein
MQPDHDAYAASMLPSADCESAATTGGALVQALGESEARLADAMLAASGSTDRRPPMPGWQASKRVEATVRHPTTNIVSGRQLRAARVLAGLTRAQLAQQAGFHERACRYWEARGDDPPTTTPSFAGKAALPLPWRTIDRPKTVEGRARIAEAQRRRWRAFRAAKPTSSRSHERSKISSIKSGRC